MRELINVIVSDGNRHISWDYWSDTSIQYILKAHKMTPVMGTIRVGGEELQTDIDLNKAKLSGFPYESAPNLTNMKRVRITFVSVKPKTDDPFKKKKKVVSA